MTVDEFNKKIQDKIDLIKQNKALELSVRSIMSVVAKRVFIEGKNTAGGVIGEYVKKPIYLNPDKMGSLPKFERKGKGGEKKFKNGKDHKTGYFDDFLDFKQTIGRNQRIKSIDLFLTGDLLRDWANAESLADAKPNKINDQYYNITLKESNYVKIEKYEESKEGKTPVFTLSKNEREIYNNVLKKELNKILNA